MPTSARWYRPPAGPWGRLSTAQGNMRANLRRPRGIPAPAGGCSHRGAPPHSLFGCAKKRMRRARWKRKNAWTRSGAVALRADGSRRIGASADFTLLSGTLRPSAIPVTAVPWQMVPALSGGLPYCLCFSFRCRWHGGQREPGQRADEGIGPYGDAEGRPFFRGCGGCERSLAFCRDTESQRFFRETESYCFCGDADGHLFFRGYQKPSSKS